MLFLLVRYHLPCIPLFLTQFFFLTKNAFLSIVSTDIVFLDSTFVGKGLVWSFATKKSASCRSFGCCFLSSFCVAIGPHMTPVHNTVPLSEYFEEKIIMVLINGRKTSFF
jgi:hypothetical protein